MFLFYPLNILNRVKAHYERGWREYESVLGTISPNLDRKAKFQKNSSYFKNYGSYHFILFPTFWKIFFSENAEIMRKRKRG